MAEPIQQPSETLLSDGERMIRLVRAGRAGRRERAAAVGRGGPFQPNGRSAGRELAQARVAVVRQRL